MPVILIIVIEFNDQFQLTIRHITQFDLKILNFLPILRLVIDTDLIFNVNDNETNTVFMLAGSCIDINVPVSK